MPRDEQGKLTTRDTAEILAYLLRFINFPPAKRISVSAIRNCCATNELPPLPPTARDQVFKHAGEFPKSRKTSEGISHPPALHQDRYSKFSFARYCAGDVIIFTGGLGNCR
jgi:hypothetical protein